MQFCLGVSEDDKKNLVADWDDAGNFCAIHNKTSYVLQVYG